MHDDRDLVEERISRELSERIVPLVHPQRRPLDVEAGASLDDVVPFEVGARWGAPWTTTWFRFSGEVPGEWSGQAGRGVARPRLPDGCPRVPVRGPRARREGSAGAGHPSTPAGRAAWPAQPGPVVLVVEAAANPAFPQFRPSDVGLTGHRRHQAAVPTRPGRARRRRRGRRGAALRPRRARRRDADAPARRPTAGAVAPPAGARRSTSSRGRGDVVAARRRCRPGAGRAGRVLTHTVSSPPVTPTSTRRGCGRRPRPSASAPARSRPPSR